MTKYHTYESSCGQFFLAPAAGTTLNDKPFSKIKSANRKFSELMTKILIDNEFSALAKMTDVITNKELSKNFIIEYQNNFAAANDNHELFDNKRSINMVLSPTIKKTLIRSYQR